MYSSGAITLVALICCHVVTEPVAARDIFAVQEKESLSHQRLVKDLAKTLTGKHPQPAYTRVVAGKVAILLAKAVDKKKPGAVLGQFSVDELLSLNHFDLDECTMTEFKLRQERCKKLEGHQNLHQYCSECLRFFERNCTLNRELIYKRACAKSQALAEGDVKFLLESTTASERLIDVCKAFQAATQDVYYGQQATELTPIMFGQVSFVQVQELCQTTLGHEQ